MSYRFILNTIENITDELMEVPFVKGCKVSDGGAPGLADIRVRISLFDFFFRYKKRVDEIHSILRPKMDFKITYEVRIKLFL